MIFFDWAVPKAQKCGCETRAFCGMKHSQAAQEEIASQRQVRRGHVLSMLNGNADFLQEGQRLCPDQEDPNF